MDPSTEINRVIQLYSNNLLKLAVSYLGSRMYAEDIVQEVFLTYYEKTPVFQEDSHEKAWFIRVTINKCKNLRKRKFFQSFTLDENLISEMSLDYQDLLKAVWQLQMKYRVPIHLFYYEGFSVKEIARILEEKEATILTRLKRAREQLKQRLGVDYFEQ